MCTKMSQLVTLLKVCRISTSGLPYSVNSFSLVRHFTTATERSDSYKDFEGNVEENQLDYRYDSFRGRNTGETEIKLNPSKVYMQSLNGVVSKFTTESSYSQNAFAVNHPGYNFGNQNTQLYHKTLGRVEQNQNPSGTRGQNANLNSHNGRVVGIPQQNYGGIRQQNLSGPFSARKMETRETMDTRETSFAGNHAETAGTSQPSVHNAGMHQQNGDGIYYSNHGDFQHNWSKSQGDRLIDYQAPGDMEPNEASVDVYQRSQPDIKIEDLDELTKGKLKEAVKLLGLLNQHGLQVDLPRYIALMKSCGDNEALEEAKSVHMHLLKSVPNIDVKIFNKILEMYSKCCSMDDAFAVFDQMPKRNMTSWDIMISGLAKNGLGEDSIELFTEFKRSGLKPDGEMFIGVFSACGVLCDTIEGMLHFESMTKDYGIIPSMEHYVSIVDMFGTAGYLDEALEFIEQMPVEPQADIWETLMKFSRIHGNVELGDRCAECVQLLDLSRLNEQSREGLIPINIEKQRAKNKMHGQNLLDRSRVHEYRAGDRSHPDHENIYALLRALKQQMKEAGYVPEVKFVLHDVDQESKEEALMAHSERLAVARGMITTAPRAGLRIIKNLRACVDCHNVFKMISKIVGRQIIVRDCKRFHHFENGSCSCKDFW